MSKRTTLATSLLIAVLLIAGIIAGRDRFLSPVAGDAEAFAVAQEPSADATAAPVQFAALPAVPAGIAPGAIAAPSAAESNPVAAQTDRLGGIVPLRLTESAAPAPAVVRAASNPAQTPLPGELSPVAAPSEVAGLSPDEQPRTRGGRHRGRARHSAEGGRASDSGRWDDHEDGDDDDDARAGDGYLDHEGDHDND